MFFTRSSSIVTCAHAATSCLALRGGTARLKWVATAPCKARFRLLAPGRPQRQVELAVIIAAKVNRTKFAHLRPTGFWDRSD